MSFIPTQAHTLMARVKASTVCGVSTCLLKIPADGRGRGRVIQGGIGWFDNHHPDDILQVSITDEDNILGLGAGVTVGSYTDINVPADNQGYYFGPDGIIHIHPVGDVGEVPAHLYLKLVATKGDGSADTFRANIFWGEKI